jgi:magnesium chelatase family protein
MVARVHTVTFQGIEALEIDVQVQVSNGLPAFNIVGLPDKAVAESKERVRAALHALGVSLPPKRLTINLAPADVPKEGSHFDLPIALGVLAAMDVVPSEELDAFTVMGELALDGSITRVNGVLAAAINAAAHGRGIICPKACGSEAAWADIDVLAPGNLLSLLNHFKGTQVLSPPSPEVEQEADLRHLDLADVKGQETAKRALEIAAAGGHNLLLMGPPGSGKSMIAARMPGILPPLSAQEALEVSMIHSVAGQLDGGRLLRQRPYRDPHHSASLPAMIGGGNKAKPGEISLAHHGVLFLDELPEFQRSTLEALRQPLETGSALVSRVNYHVTFPARFQLIAAMNPCRCGHLADADLACNRAPKCGLDYQAKISGPLFDRIDLHVEVPAVHPLELSAIKPSESSAEVAKRVDMARALQSARYAGQGITTNAEADGDLLDRIAPLNDAGRSLLVTATERMKLSARGYHRVLRVARTLADLQGAEDIHPDHVAEAIGYRRLRPGQAIAA